MYTNKIDDNNVLNNYYILYRFFIFWIVFHGLITKRLAVAQSCQIKNKEQREKQSGLFTSI